jgi:hypothetical protein
VAWDVAGNKASRGTTSATAPARGRSRFIGSAFLLGGDPLQSSVIERWARLEDRVLGGRSDSGAEAVSAWLTSGTGTVEACSLHFEKFDRLGSFGIGLDVTAFGPTNIDGTALSARDRESAWESPVGRDHERE